MRHPLAVRALAIVTGIALAAPARAQPPSRDSLRQILKRATYVFQGVVEKWDAVADSALPRDPRHAVVTVTRVFSCPVAVGDFKDERVTIRYASPRIAPPGTEAWFFGTGWVVGEHLATSVLALVPVRSPAQTDRLLSTLHAAVQLNTRDALQAAVQSTDQAVLATVLNLGGSYLPSGTPRSEHAEYWSVVRVAIDSLRRSGVWVTPPDSLRQITILAPPEPGYDTTASGHLSRNARKLLFLDFILRQPGLKSVDSTAVAFLPTRADIHDVSDAALLGNSMPNPLFGLQPVHECGRPFR